MIEMVVKMTIWSFGKWAGMAGRLGESRAFNKSLQRPGKDFTGPATAMAADLHRREEV